jgi:hypothetical protein
VAGIHLHPHDILDEGTDAILRRIDGLADTDLLFVEVNTIFERNPYPTGVLPHNPVHDVVLGTGTLHARLPASTTRIFQRVDPSVLAGVDPLRTVVEATLDTRFKVVPWVNVLNGDFLGAALENAVVDHRGDPIDHWLCPNAADVSAMWVETLSAIQTTYGLSTFLIDRIRYPDWAGVRVNPRGLLTCFCRHCRLAMDRDGIDAGAVTRQLDRVIGQVKRGEFDGAADGLRHDPVLRDWHSFRQRSVTALIQRLRAGTEGHAIELWLDLWPPAYSWILGQDYTALTRVSRVLKHFPYHKLGGGADVQGLITHIARDETSRELAFDAFKRLFSLPFALTYAQFSARGFPIEFVRQQNDRVRQLSLPGTVVYSGIQMWNVSPAELLDAIEAADTSACDDIIYYCYGWAGDALFDAAGSRRRP